MKMFFYFDYEHNLANLALGCIIMLVYTSKGTSFGKPGVHYFNMSTNKWHDFKCPASPSPNSNHQHQPVMWYHQLKACFYSYLKPGYTRINTCSSKFEGISKSDPEALASSSIASCKSWYRLQMNYDFKKVYRYMLFN